MEVENHMLQSSLQGGACMVMDLAFRLLTKGSRVKRCTFLSSFWFQFVDNEGEEIKVNQAKLLRSNMKHHVHWLFHWTKLVHDLNDIFVYLSELFLIRP